jgi:hypothetical protein
MTSIPELVQDFLQQQRIAIAGVSRRNDNAPANLIFRKLEATGHEPIAVNPAMSSYRGTKCYPALGAIPGRVGAALLALHPSRAPELVRQCADCGISRVWMHGSFGAGSVSDEAAGLCRELGIRVIAGGCPMMYCKPVDFGHKCMRWMLGVTGGLPK